MDVLLPRLRFQHHTQHRDTAAQPRRLFGSFAALKSQAPPERSCEEARFPRSSARCLAGSRRKGVRPTVSRPFLSLAVKTRLFLRLLNNSRSCTPAHLLKVRGAREQQNICKPCPGRPNMEISRHLLNKMLAEA